MSEQFEREDRYIVLKLKRLPGDEAEYIRDCHPQAMVDCVVVERDWPEYHLVWAMIEHRMAGKPVPDFNLWRRSNELQERLNAADQRNDDLSGMLQHLVDNPYRFTDAYRDRIAAVLNPTSETPDQLCDAAKMIGIERMPRMEYDEP